MQTLSKKGVLFLTAGFHQPYIFQNVTHILEYEQYSKVLAIFKTILSDGEIYISGVYYIKTLAELEKCERIRDFDILKLYAIYQRTSNPILITSLQILSQNHRGIYGKTPISIIDYLESKVIQEETHHQSNLHFGRLEPQRFEEVSKVDKKIGKNPNQEINIDQSLPLNQKDVEIDKPVVQMQKDVEIDKSRPVNDQKEYEKSSNPSKQRQKQKEVSFSQDPQNQQFFHKADNQTQENKRNQRIEIEQEVNNNPHKKLKPNEEQEEGEMIFTDDKFSRSDTQKKIDNSQSLQTQPLKQNNLKTNDILKNNELTQKISIPPPQIIEIDVFDLDVMSTKKQTFSFYPQSNRKQIRKSHLKLMESILQSEQKPQKHQAEPDQSLVNSDSITIPISHVFNELKATPTKSQPTSFPISPYPRQMGTTTQKKKIREEYNLLISNLYESNQSFKIICRVNYLYEWRSKNDVPCLALDLMDSEGAQIKAIIYMNHSTKDCKECGSMIEVGKVYCFQNGQCKRDYFEKQGLELVFNLKTKQLWGKQLVCGGKNKIIPTKIRIQPLLQHRVLSISQLIENYDSGKNIQTNVYGILQSLKVSQYESKTKDSLIQRQDESPEIQIAQTNPTPQQKSVKKGQTISKVSPQGYTKLYLNGFLTDPLEKNKIFFTLVITKPKSEQSQLSKDFLQKNMIKQGSLVVLHNVKIHANNTNTVRKLQKTKKTYLQLITNENMTWKYNKQDFGAEIVVLPQNIDGSGLYSVFHEILSLSPIELQLVYQNPRFINYSQQPYTTRTILQMNELLEKSMLPDQSCYSEFKDAKLHSIEQKPSIELCQCCKKKVKSPQKSLEDTSRNDSIKHCSRCNKIVKIFTMHVFNVVFADNTASFAVEVVKDEYIETILGMKVEEFLAMTENERKDYLQLTKYTDFMLHIRSQNKIGGAIHKITSIEKYSVKSKLDEIKTERKGVQKHYKQLESSW